MEIFVLHNKLVTEVNHAHFVLATRPGAFVGYYLFTPDFSLNNKTTQKIFLLNEQLKKIN